MIKNYFKIAYRSLWRNSSFSFINILGLAGGMAVCMFILTLIIDQNNIDTFHEKEDRIYRVVSVDGPSIYATAPVLVKDELHQTFSNVEEVATIRRTWNFDLKFEEKSLPFEGLYSSPSIQDKDKKTEAQVIGVVDNFVHHFIASSTMPLMLTYQVDKVEAANLKIAPQDIPETLAFIEAKWSALDPIHPIDYRFFDEQLYEQVAIFEDAVKLIGFLAFITILITCMGLLGIANYTVQTRQKEIGIRKVLGADLKRVLWTLSKGMIYPIAMAVVISLPIAWLLNSLWLEEFAYRVSLSVSNIGFGMFLLSVLVVAIVMSQSYRVANRNPVMALRTE